jgi:GntR family transcriptional regulator
MRANRSLVTAMRRNLDGGLCDCTDCASVSDTVGQEENQEETSPVMWLRIDPSKSDPIFEQIRQGVRTAVARGEVADGYKLPSVRELARELSVNPNTVVRAYEVLQQDGVIVKRQGAGCFVQSQGTLLRDEERLRRLDEISERLVTEAYHLGFNSAAVKQALRRALDKADMPRRTQK